MLCLGKDTSGSEDTSWGAAWLVWKAECGEELAEYRVTQKAQSTAARVPVRGAGHGGREAATVR